MTQSSWTLLGRASSEDLAAARTAAHFAAQIPAAAGNSLARPEPDYAHLSLTWSSSARALVGPALDGSAVKSDMRIGLRLSDLTVLALDRDGSVVDALSLAGRTLDEGLDWLARASGAPRTAIELPGHDMPEHELGDGARFPVSLPALAELEAWFEASHAILTELHEGHEHATPVRAWPHHFDIASLWSLDPELDPEEARSINVGLSPGDGGIAEPYFYVVPYPAPESPQLASLAGGGRWQTDGWLGAVLRRSHLVGDGDDGGRRRSVVEFLRSGIDGSRMLLEP